MTLRDSRGKKSKTLLFVAPAVAVLIVKFMAAGLTLFGVSFPDMSAGDFGAAFAVIVAVWLGREWTDLKREGSRDA